MVLISLDTLRQDHVGAYVPGEPSATPNLDAFATESIILESVWAPVPFTLPSHMTMFTSLDPDVHGVTTKRSRLSETLPTLPEKLRSAGYRTAGVVSNLWMKGEFGFARGFDEYERVPYGLTYADRIIGRAFELVEQGPAGEPLFLFLHFIDAHSDFADVTENSLPYFVSNQILERLGVDPVDPRFCDDEGRCATDFLIAADDESRQVDPATVDLMAALYRGGVEDLDRSVGSFFAGLRQRGLYDDALIVVTADHGEEFREHGLFIHVQPYVESLAVPMMIRLPGGAHAGRRVDVVAELTDLKPTLLELLGLPLPGGLQGRSLASHLVGPAAPATAHAALGRDKKRHQRYSLRTHELTLIHDFESGRSELYDRLLDPDETIDVGSRRPDDVARLLADLRSRLRANQVLRASLSAPEADPSPAADVLTDEERDRLRAIGYLD